MKKNIEKILASASIIIALVLIIILLVTAFGGIKQEEFDNDLVKGLFITLGVLYIVLAGGMLAMLFLAGDAAREITLRSEQGGNCKATLGVIRKLVKQTFAEVDGVKTGKVGLVVNEYGVKLKVSVRIKDKDVFETETYLRTLLEEVFKGALGFRFHVIEFKITALQAKFKPDKAKVDAAVAEKVAEHEPNYAALPNAVERTASKETVENREDAAEAADNGEADNAAEYADGAESAADVEQNGAYRTSEEPVLNEGSDSAADAIAQMPEYGGYDDDRTNGDAEGKSADDEADADSAAENKEEDADKDVSADE